MRQSGFTLSEIIVSVLIASFGFLALSTVALYGFREFMATKGKLEAQAESIRFQYLMVSLFSQAVDVRAGDPLTAGGEGRVREFNYDRIAAAPPPIELIASFRREANRGPGPGPAAQIYNPANYRQTAIWWRRPVANAPVVSGALTNSGAVFFDLGFDGSNGQPDYGDHFTGRMIELQIQRELGGAANDRVAAIQVRSIFRYHRPSQERPSWCPEQDIAAAVGNCAVEVATYMDVEKRFRIVLRNNILNDVSPTGGLLPERPTGMVHYFMPMIPSRWSFN